MNTSFFPRVAAGATAALAAALPYAAHAPAAAKTPPKPVMVASAAQGNALVGQYRCNGCHAPNLAGRQGFSPSLYPNASLKEYKQASFVHMLLTDITPDGSHIRPPMPAYGAGMMRMRPGGMRPGGMRSGRSARGDAPRRAGRFSASRRLRRPSSRRDAAGGYAAWREAHAPADDADPGGQHLCVPAHAEVHTLK